MYHTVGSLTQSVERWFAEQEAVGSFFGNAWKVGVEGRHSQISCRYLERGRSGGSRAQFPGSSRREEHEAAGSISGTGWDREARGRWFNFRDLVGERRNSLLV